MKSKNIAKILSLICLMSSILSCKTDTDSDNTPPQIIEIENGVADWNDFITTAGDDFSNQIDNFDAIDGFKGYATYTEIKSFFNSAILETIAKKRYNTENLQIFFDTYPTNEVKEESDTSDEKEENNTNETKEESDITPSVLNELFTHFTNVNITGTNNSNGSFDYIKISSGSDNEIFDINKFYERLSKGEFSINGITTQSENTKMLLGIDDKYLSENLSIDIEKLNYLLQNEIFKNALIDKVILSGNISGVETLYPREAKERNITFTDDAYSAPKTNDIDTLTLQQLSERQIRSFKMIIANTNITGDSFTQTAENPLDLSNSSLNNVSFESDTDLSKIPFNNITAKGNLTFKGILPSEMKYLNAENLILNNAVVPSIAQTTTDDSAPDSTVQTSTNITALKANNLKVEGSLTNETLFISDENAPRGEIINFTGSKILYDTLIKILNIQNPKIKEDIVKLLLINNQKQYV
ncbi:hypothetical protein HDR60_05775 [bacterium]|nr:hypothetical protein [bacterium]